MVELDTFGGVLREPEEGQEVPASASGLPMALMASPSASRIAATISLLVPKYEHASVVARGGGHVAHARHASRQRLSSAKVASTGTPRRRVSSTTQ